MTGERSAERKALARRRRRLIFNNDGDDLFSMRPDEHGSAAEALLAERTTALWGSQVDSIWYYSTHGMRLHHSGGPLGRLYGCPDPDATATANYRLLLAEGADALEVMIEACRQHGLEIFYSNRMNDCHDAFDDAILYHLRRQHPEWSLSTREEGRRHRYPEIRSLWTAWNFEVDAIRDLTVEAMREVARTYDIDGIELDFWRFTCYFPESMRHEPVTAAHRDLMTDLVRRIRHAVDEEADRRGRPVLLAGRCVGDQEISRNAGLDVEAWLEEGLVDLLSLAYGAEHIPADRPAGDAGPPPRDAAVSDTRAAPQDPRSRDRPRARVETRALRESPRLARRGGCAARAGRRWLSALQLLQPHPPAVVAGGRGGDDGRQGHRVRVGLPAVTAGRLPHLRGPAPDPRPLAGAGRTPTAPSRCRCFVGEEIAPPPAGIQKRHASLCVHITCGLTRHHQLWLTVNGSRLDRWRPAAAAAPHRRSGRRLDRVPRRPAGRSARAGTRFACFVRSTSPGGRSAA